MRLSPRFWVVPAVLAVASIAVAGGMRSDAAVESRGPVHAVVSGDLRYEFHAAWRTENLWRRDAAGVWRRVAGPDAAALDGLRARLLAAHGASSLDDIPGIATDELEAFRALGYL